MRFLLLLVWVTFFFLFFLFSKISGIEWFLFQNLFYQANIYVFVSVLFLFWSIRSDSQHHTREEKKESIFWPLPSFGLGEIKSFISYFFSDIIYYISIGLFYGALYLLFWELFWRLQITQLFLFFNIIVCFLFLLEKKVSLFWDLLRVNTSIISLYYIAVHIIYLFWGNIDFSLYDLWNILCIMLLIYLFLFRSSLIIHKKIFYSYALSFVFLESLVLCSFLFERNIALYMMLSCLFWIIFSLLTDDIHKRFSIPITLVRTFSLIFFLLTLSFWIFFIFWAGKYIVLTVSLILISSIFLFGFHYLFQNYIAAFAGSLGILSSVYWCLSLSISSEKIKIYAGAFYIGISFAILFIHRLSYFRYDFDKYFFHVLSFFVNLVWVILFLFFAKTSILTLACILLLESVYFSLLYYSFKK